MLVSVDYCRSRGLYDCGVECPNCGHDWRYHKDGICGFIIDRGVNRQRLCACSAGTPLGVKIPIITSDGILYQYAGGPPGGWELPHKSSSPYRLWAATDLDNTYVVENHYDAVEVMLGEHPIIYIEQPILLGKLTATTYQREDGGAIGITCFEWYPNTIPAIRYSFP